MEEIRTDEAAVKPEINPFVYNPEMIIEGDEAYEKTFRLITRYSEDRRALRISEDPELYRLAQMIFGEKFRI